VRRSRRLPAVGEVTESAHTCGFLTEQLNSDDRRRYAEWEAIVDLLMRADHMLTTGAITVPQHEVVWWQAYDRLKVGAHA
jgi:hypothetical protein